MAGSGLEGVVAAQTRLSDVNGEAGRLVIAGAQVEDLAALPYETVLERLLGEPVGGLGAARVKAFARLPALGSALDALDGMDALRGSVGQLDGASGPLDVVAATAVFAAAWSRKRRGLEPVAPDASLSHAADYLRMLPSPLGEGREREALRGEGQQTPASARDHGFFARAMNAYLVTVIDHGMNASTFTARVIASTSSDLVSAITGALGALKGPLHGGAPGPVLDMLDAVGSPERAEAWLAAELEAGRRIMGMGHRVYRVRDPRAAVLERTLEQLATSVGDQALSARLPLARAVEQAATRLLKNRYPDRELKANVEFYTAVLLDALGVDRAAFTPTFAVGRAGGWVAHALEQRSTGRLIRPSSEYVGPVPT